jgi:threonine synthase
MNVFLRCIDCGEEYPCDKLRYNCECGGLLEVQHDLQSLNVSRELFEERWGSRKFPYNSGVWRYKELIFPVDDKYIVSKGEGTTNLYNSKKVAEFVGLEEIFLKHEGENPTGSFKDRGMTAGITHANFVGSKIVACASTGNTSASMASYASWCGKKGVVFIPDGEIAFGKLAQALAYGAKTLQIKGNFDDAMKLVVEASEELGLYLLNSINPFRIEGQKAIGVEAIQQLDWDVPDWFVLPGGNLGNGSALGKGLRELRELGIIDKIPRIAIIQASGANPLYTMRKENSSFSRVEGPKTIATAIQIGNPVSWKKIGAVLDWCDGVVEQVTDQEIMDAKAKVDASGIGAEPASCATVAGTKKLVDAGIIKSDERVVGILTGNLLKDPGVVVNYHQNTLEGLRSTYANPPVKIGADIASVKEALGV